MNTITFAGINGQIIESSEHGNYLVIKLTNRISICGTYTNIWYWREQPDNDSNFKSFITYIGFNTNSVKQKYLDLINDMNGVVRDNESCRKRQRVTGRFRYEMKVRNLSIEHLLDLIAVI